MEHLNSDLHDLIYSGEDGESGAEDAYDGPLIRQRSKKVIGKKIGSGKPQNLDLLPACYSMEQNEPAAAQSQYPSHLNLDMVSNVSENELQNDL